MKARLSLLLVALIAGKLFWLGYEAVRLESFSLGATMIAGAFYIILNYKTK